ncbi:MAG: hypothetical protein HC897_09800 [Thermoanaerobaculia bacterium]|nr:hypothetical protein [Thermoanaerobaculia bacterium]
MASSSEPSAPQPESRHPAARLALNLGLALVTLAVLGGAIEIGLRVQGFKFVLYPEQIEFGNPDPVTLKTGFRPDDDLFWVTPGYAEKLALFERDPPKLVFLGDSCTQFGHYDQELAQLFSKRRGTRLWYGNVGVAGWTSYQGRRQLERDVIPLLPSVVTILYGWNDHWIGFGVEDKNIARLKKVFSSRWSRLRLIQLATKAALALSSRETPWPNRVSRADFKDNLRAMVALASSRNVRAVLITAPSSHVAGAEPAYLTDRWLRQRSDLVPLHQSYVEAVREVARELPDAILCDAAADFAELPQDELADHFMADGIHFTPRATSGSPRCFSAASSKPVCSQRSSVSHPRAAAVCASRSSRRPPRRPRRSTSRGAR